MDDVFDLFGHPVTPGRGLPGRPRKVATTEDRNKVKLLMALGWANPRIANAVRMSLPTFRQNFFHELAERDQMRDRLEATRLSLAWEQAQKGNVGAMRQLDRLIDANDRMAASTRMTEGQDDGDPAAAEDRPAPRAIGKKEAQRQAAQAPGGEGSAFGDLLRPGFDRVN